MRVQLRSLYGICAAFLWGTWSPCFYLAFTSSVVTVLDERSNIEDLDQQPTEDLRTCLVMCHAPVCTHRVLFHEEPISTS